MAKTPEDKGREFDQQHANSEQRAKERPGGKPAPLPSTDNFGGGRRGPGKPPKK